MADKKISALPASTTPLAGTEVLPIVQSSTTKQVSVANLTAGRAIGATSIQFGSGSILSSYEEGTWTPAVAGSATAGTATYGAQVGQYTKVGNRVHINLTVSYSGGTGVGFLQINGLPFAANSTANNYQTLSIYAGALALSVLQIPVPLLAPGSSTILINYNTVAGGTEGNVPYDAAAFIVISGSYIV
jgi:hypothetical protein